MILQGKAGYPVKEAIIHCAGIKTGQFSGQRGLQIFAEINMWHRARGWKNGFGYHGLITASGEFLAGRPYTMIGAHTLGHNRGTLGFLLIESRKVTEIGEFDDWFTFPQRDELRRRLSVIPGLEKVTGHNDYDNRLCPGFKVETQDWLS